MMIPSVNGIKQLFAFAPTHALINFRNRERPCTAKIVIARSEATKQSRRGDYIATVEGSEVRREAFKATLWLRLICRNKFGVFKTMLAFRIHDPNPDKQDRERVKVGDLGVAMGVYRFDDSDQLHDKPFMLTAWDDRNERFSFRPALVEMVSGGQR